VPPPDPDPADVWRERAGLHAVELRQLAAFVAVADHGHFGRAANAIHVSQPTLSKLVRRLEDQLGTPLFLRDTRNVRLSPAGDALLTDARLALDHVARGIADARAVAEGQSGEVVVGYSPAVRQTASTVLAAFAAARPHVEVAHRQEYAIWLSRRVERGDLDAAIVVAGRHPPTVEAMPLRDVELACMVSAHHPLADRESVAFTELERHAIAAPQPDNPSWREQLDALAVRDGITLTLEPVRDPMGMAHEMVRARPDLVVVRPLEDLEPGYGRILPIVPAVGIRWDLLWNPRSETEVVRVLVSVARSLRDERTWLA
jgi:DNA-binding transcriptional LysR family regulator